MPQQEKKIKGINFSTELFGASRPTFEEWTAEDERKLEKLQDLDNIAMADTAVGREREMMKQGVMSAGVNLSEEEWVKLTELRKRKWGESES